VVRRELENPSTRRCSQASRRLPRASLPASALFLEAADLTLALFLFVRKLEDYLLVLRYHVRVTRPSLGRTDVHKHCRTRLGACPQVDWGDSKADGIRVFVLQASQDLLEEATQLEDGSTGT
jgi:hypothetical protein